MIFDKFKNIDMPDIDLSADSDYVKKLDSLPEKKHKKQILPIIGTVAASFIVIIAVAVWAIIGRGIRMEKPTATPADDSKAFDFSAYAAMGADVASEKEIEIEQAGANRLVPHSYKLGMMPLFDSDNPPSLIEMTRIAKAINGDICDGDALNRVAAMFGTSYDTEQGVVYNHGSIYRNKYEKYHSVVAKKAMRYTMDGGKYNYVILYEYRGKEYVISFVGDENIHRDPTQYILNLPVEGEYKKDYADEGIYEAVKTALYSDPNVKSADFSIGVVDKFSDSLYSCRVEVTSVVYNDEGAKKPILFTEWTDAVELRIVYFDCKNGKFSISDDQDRIMPIEILGGYDCRISGENGQYYKDVIINNGFISMDEFENDSGIAAGSPEKDPPEFKITSATSLYCRFEQFFSDVSFVVDGKEYTVRYSGNDEIRVFSKKQNKLYIGTESTLPIDTSKYQSIQPYGYTAAEIENNIPEIALIGQSMGITIPNIDTEMIEPYDAVPIVDDPKYAELVKELTSPQDHGDHICPAEYTEEELRRRGYTQYDRMRSDKYYNVSMHSPQKSELMNRFPVYCESISLISNNWSRYVYILQLKNKLGYRYYLDAFTENQLLTLKDYGIVPRDIDYLLEKYGDADKILGQSQKELKASLTEHYQQKYKAVFGHEYQ